MNKFTFPKGIPISTDTLVFAGDSITYGYNASDTAHRWTSLLCASYQCTEDNKGVNGKRVDDFDWTTIPAKTESIKYMFVAFGINDIFAASISASDFYTNYIAKLDYLHNTKGYAYEDIIILTPYYVNPEAYNVDTDGTLVKHLAFRQKVFDLALLKGCNLADVYEWMVEQPDPLALVEISGNYLHPNDAGYAVISDFFDFDVIPLIKSAIVKWANLNSVTTISNGSWLQAIAESLGITDTVNGSWLQALAEYAGATEPVNGSWLIALCYALGITHTINGSWWEALAASGSFVNTDPDSDAFIAAAGITDPVQQAALDTLVVGLKGVNLWSKLLTIYPMVGGSATSHKFNLKNPLDINAAYRLNFQGGWIHSATGAKPNGVNAYADTNFNPFTGLTSNDEGSLGYYTPDNANQPFVDMGCLTAASAAFAINSGYNGMAAAYAWDQTSGIIVANAETKGFYAAVRLNNTDLKAYKNGYQIGTTQATPGGTRPNINVVLGAYNINWTINYHSTREISFAFIGKGLDATESASLYTFVQAFQTTLGRNV